MPAIVQLETETAHGPGVAYPDAEMFGTIPQSATDGLDTEQFITAATERVNREMYLARVRNLVQIAGEYAGKATGISDVYDWDGTRRMMMETLEHVTRRLLPDFDGDSADIAKAVTEDI